MSSTPSAAHIVAHPPQPDHPFHRLTSGNHDDSSAVERGIWLNPPVDRTVLESITHLHAVPSTHGTGHASIPARNQFGQPTPTLLAGHLQIVTSMQGQVHSFKAQMRHMLECFGRYAQAIEQQQQSGSSTLAIGAASLDTLKREFREVAQGLYLAHAGLIAPLVGKEPSDRVMVGGRTLLKKDLFGTRDSGHTSA